ncbi:MAG: ABC-2 family transporter protein [Deltaproteobacteria bacterium]
MNEARRVARAVPGMFRVGLAAALAYRSEFLIWVLTTNMPLVMLALWSAVAHDAPVGRFGERDFAAYFLAALVVRLVTSSWVVWEMNWEIRQGTLSTRLLRPIHPFLSYAVDNLAALPMRLLIALPITVVALTVVGRGQLAHDPVAWLAVLPALAGAWAVNFAVMALIGTLGVFIDSSLAVFDAWLAFSVVLSGYIVPLELLPAGVRHVARWLPFRYLLSFPVEIVTGQLSRHDLLVALGVQWLYVGVLLLVALRLWRAAVARFAAFGG